jgi:hypothetical protein
MESTGYYYAEETRNGRQWFRITPNGDWMPKPATPEQKYDRAGIAARVMCGLISSGERGNVWEDAVHLTDQLISELQRTENAPNPLQESTENAHDL